MRFRFLRALFKRGYQHPHSDQQFTSLHGVFHCLERFECLKRRVNFCVYVAGFFSCHLYLDSSFWSCIRPPRVFYRTVNCRFVACTSVPDFPVIVIA